jgi:hypothetical protein
MVESRSRKSSESKIGKKDKCRANSRTRTARHQATPSHRPLELVVGPPIMRHSRYPWKF